MSAVPWDPRLSAWLDTVEAEWVRSGLSPLACGEMRARLVEDLVQSLLQGAPVEDVVDADPVRFAGDVALASGYEAVFADDAAPLASGPWAATSRAVTRTESMVRALPERTRFVVGAMAGAIVGAVVSFYVLEHVGFVISETLGLRLGYAAEGLVTTLGLFAVAALGAAASGGLGVLVVFHDSKLGCRLARAAFLALLVSGALITLPTMGFAWTTGYSTLSGVVLTEVAMVVLALVIGLVVAAEVVWRRTLPSGRVPENAR